MVVVVISGLRLAFCAAICVEWGDAGYIDRMMDKSHEQKSAVAHLYPSLEPYERRILDVGDGHSLYVEESGNPRGRPVVVLHGGPGGGSSPMMRRFFDPAHYRIVLFDQRGCGRSRPHASVTANTTQHLIRDIEQIRETLGIDRWIVFGGSWGATLALAYAQTHPARAAWLVLRGVFLGTAEELDWFYGGGAGRFYPDLWSRFVDPIPEGERGNLIAAYQEMGDEVEVQIVAYGPGLHMLRADTSPVAQRVATMALEHPNVTFQACNNTINAMQRQSGAEVTLLPEAHIVPAGVVHLVQLQEQGWSYIRP